MPRRLFTIGVYGRDGESFAEALADYSVDALVDIRARRGVRGAQYAWANARRLEADMQRIGVAYMHIPTLAPFKEVRALQKSADLSASVAKRDRTRLASAFSQAYTQQVLQPLDRQAVAEDIYGAGERPALLCVETSANACHRSLVAVWLNLDGDFEVTHL